MESLLEKTNHISATGWPQLNGLEQCLLFNTLKYQLHNLDQVVEHQYNPEFHYSIIPGNTTRKYLGLEALQKGNKNMLTISCLRQQVMTVHVIQCCQVSASFKQKNFPLLLLSPSGNFQIFQIFKFLVFKILKWK